MDGMAMAVLAAALAFQSGVAGGPTAQQAERNARAAQLVRAIDESGQVLVLGTDPTERLEPPHRLAPGTPPLLAFRYFEGKDKHRFAELDLVMDDAGH